MQLRSLLLLILLSFVSVGQAGPVFAAERLVAIVLTGNLERHRVAHQAFTARLESLPPLPGVRTYIQTPNPDPISLANSIRKAVAIGSELIICYGTQAAIVAKKEARHVPVLFADVYDPVTLGVVRCIDDVACEISGISGSTPVHTLLKALTRIRPVPELGVLYTDNDPGSEHQFRILDQIGPGFGMTVSAENVRKKSDLSEAVKRLTDKADILFLTDSTIVQQNLDLILPQARGQGGLVVSQIPGLSKKGALMTLEPNPGEQGEKLAEYAHNVLNGSKVRTLPVISPQQVELVVNLRVAKEHRLKIPFEVLTMTTRIIK